MEEDSVSRREEREAKRRFYTHKGHIDLLFIAEAPPNALDRFFYFIPAEGSIEIKKYDWLFVYTVKALFQNTEKMSKSDVLGKKKYYLEQLRDHRFLELDALCDPIGGRSQKRIKAIQAGCRDLFKMIKSYTSEKSGIIDSETKIVLVKATVFHALFELDAYRDAWKKSSYRVLNNEAIDFPSKGNQLKFLSKIDKLPIEKWEPPTKKEGTRNTT